MDRIKNITDIEIFPAHKSCAQGCAICPLSSRGHTSSQVRIDTNVQETISLLEETINQIDGRYNIHFTGALSEDNSELFPTLKHPERLHMARFETHERVRREGGVKEFTREMRRILEREHINPDTIGFSIVPESPLINHVDAYLMRTTIEGIGEWFFDSTPRNIEVTIRSNMIPMETLRAVSSQLLSNDEKYIRPILEQYIDPQFISVTERKKITHKSVNYTFYYNEYSTLVPENNSVLSISNRAIALHDRKMTKNLEKKQAIYAMCMTNGGVNIAVAPQGVMILHVSAFINNPILWLSHDDFRTTLRSRSKKPGFSMTGFASDVIQENLIFYSLVKKKLQGTWKEAFQDNRDQVRAFIDENNNKLISEPAPV